ncbi:MAG: hypothetical protein ACREPM_00565 [Gemmatimonadaceae bacterium]
MGLRIAVFVLAASTMLAAETAAQNPPASAKTATAVNQRYRYRVLGVYDEATGEPVDGVEVRDVLTGLSATTTSTGTVSLIFLPDGGGLVRLRKIGYELQTLMVAIAPADTAPVTLTMRRAVELPAVVVKDSAPSYLSPRLRDAESRLKSHAGGHFIDEATMRKWDHSTLDNAIIASMPGLYATTGPHGETFMLSTRSTCTLALSCGRANCYITVYIDGTRLLDPSGGPIDIRRLSPQDYAIAEFYPGGASMPVQYQASTCGVLLLWSRER